MRTSGLDSKNGVVNDTVNGDGDQRTIRDYKLRN